MHEFRLPDVGEGVHEGELIEWLVEAGDPVQEDQPVAKVETDKALVDVPAPVDGAVRELRWSEGDVVPVGEVLLVFDVEGEDGEQTGQDATAGAGAEPAAGEGASGSASASEETGRSESTGGRGGRVFAAPSARRLARELGVDVAAVDGSGPGGRVTEGDVRAAAAEPADDGAAVQAGEDAASPADGDTAGGSATARSEPAPDDADGRGTARDATDPVDAGTTTAADRDRTLATPATRRAAREAGVDLDAVPAVEERDGEAFVTEDAVREYAAEQQHAQAADSDAVTAADASTTGDVGAVGSTGSHASGTGDPGGAGERREPYRGVRRSIGEAMSTAKFTAPHVTHHDEVDVTRLVAVKERLAAHAAERGVRLTYLPFVLRAVTAALREYPILNSSLDEEAEEIVYHDRYDVGIATATDAGLLVPVVEAVDEKPLLDIATEVEELTGRARDRSIAPEELRGSTFTVTNVGAIGGEYATPILNHPEVGILALGQIRRKPRVVEDEDGNESIEPRSILPLSLSIDHRVVDGAEAAHFTNAVRDRLRDPALLLVE